MIGLISKQSADIAKGVESGGAGDQGIVYSYAMDETPELMPLLFMVATLMPEKLRYIETFLREGFFADTGVTGRKIIADSYGGVCRHGGGAFSGKDPTKIDRSGAYMARKIARDIVAADNAHRCEVQIAYAIGVAEPVAVSVNTFGTGKFSDDVLADLVKAKYDLTPRGIIEQLHLKDVDYNGVSAYGHFGKAHLPWEQ